MIPLGARYMLLSAMGFALMGVFVKLSGQLGMPVMQIIAARALVSLLISYADVKRKRIAVFGTHVGLLLLRGIVGFVALTCVYYSLLHLPLAEATVLQYIHPIFTAILAVFVLNEKPTAATLVCIVLSFVGLLIMVRPDFLFGNGAGDFSPAYNLFAVSMGLLGALGSSLAYILVRKLSRLEDPAVIVLYFPLVCLPATLILSGHEFVMPSGWAWVTLLLVGLFTQVGQVALTKGMQLETASRASSFSYSQVIFASFFGMLIFNEIPVAWTFIGGGLIMLGALFSLFWRQADVGRKK